MPAFPSSRHPRHSAPDQRPASSPAPKNRPDPLPVASRADISAEEIARRAFSRWESSDRSHGRDQEHWFAAEEELRRGRGEQTSTPDVVGGATS
jgi:hypothetical protein